VLATTGSLGDLHPFMAVALAVRERGFDPVIASYAEYGEKVRAEGIEFQAVRPSLADLERDLGADARQITERLLQDPELLFRGLIFPYLKPAYEDLMQVSAQASAIMTSSLAISARLAAQTRGCSWVAAVLQPSMFLSAFDPPVLMPGRWISRALRRLGPRVSAVAISILRSFVNRRSQPVHALRRELGLPTAPEEPVFAGQFGAGGALGLYSRLLGSAQPDYPADTAITGFCFYDSASGRGSDLSPALSEFLERGPPPLVFTLGSFAFRGAGNFYRESAVAAQRLGRRAVLLLGDTPAEGWMRSLPPEIFVGDYAPYSRLFPRAAVVVHQGGIGTLAQCLRAARAQLIVPFFGDQADNAARALRLGVARSLPRERYDARRAQSEIARLLQRADYAMRATQLQAELSAEHGPVQAAVRLCRFAATGVPVGADGLG
jgi:UDP:flavonoid glycosyltransferase YjiC (YdhE family)